MKTDQLIALVLVFYTLLADQVRKWLSNQRRWKIQNRLGGILMIGAWIVLTMVSR